MKLFLVLIFCSVFLKSLATHGFGSKLHLQPLQANPHYQDSRHMNHHLRLGTRKNLPRIILIKNLLELNCLKEFYHQNKMKNKNTLKITPGLHEEAKVSTNLLTPTLETENYQLVDRKDIKIKNEVNNNKKYFENKKKSVLIDTDENLNRLNTVQEKRHNQTEGEKNLVIKNTGEKIQTGVFNEKLSNEHRTEKAHVFQAGEQVPSKHTITLENTQQSFVAVENEDSDVSSSDDGKFFKLPLTFNQATKAPHAESTIENSWILIRPSKVKPYEVEETVDESIKVNTNDATENEKMKGSDSQTEVYSIPSIKDKKKTEDTTKKNSEDTFIGINNSISAILQGLINPRIKTATTKQAGTKTTLRPFLQKLASGSEFTQNVKAGGSINNTKSVTGPFQNFGSFPNSFFKDRKQLNSSTPYPTHQTEGKPLRNTQKWFPNRNQRPNTPLGSINYRKNFRVPNFVRNQTKQMNELQTQYYEETKAKNHSELESYISQQDQVHAARRMDEFLDTLLEVQNSKEELIKENSTTKELNATGKSYSNGMETTKHQDESLTMLSSSSALKDLSGPAEKLINEYIVTTLKLSSTREVFTAPPTTVEQGLSRFFTPKNYSISATGTFSKSVRSPETSTPNFELTTFKEFNDDPMAFDLLADKKQPTLEEAKWKNSRKIHFNNGSQKVNVSNKTQETEQRRSDILISDVPEEYSVGGILDNALTNFSHLQVNGSRQFPNLLNDLTLDLLIQYIPTIINHIREGKFSSEDSLVLSKIFGKYWPDILTLSNNTNIDILPLFQIKNEKDLESILQSYKLEKSTTKIVNNSINMSEDHTYDYLDEFKDLYQELGDDKTENQKSDVKSKDQYN